MTRKYGYGSMRCRKGSVAARLSLAAGVLLMLLAGATEARDPNNKYSEYNMFLRNLEIMIQDIQHTIDEYAFPLDVISLYYTNAILALGSTHETQSEWLHSLNYSSTDQIKAGAALLNKTIPTYSQFSFQSYIDMSENAELDSEFDRMVTQYLPFIEKRRFNTLCEYAEWATQFDPQQTSKGPFYRTDGSVADITVMSRTGLALYKEDKDQFKMQMLTLPFASLDSVLILMKPNDGTNIDTFAKKVYSDFDNLVKNVIYQQAPTNVKIRLPKYKNTWYIDFLSLNPLQKKIWTHLSQIAIVKNCKCMIIHFDFNITMELNEEGINYQAKAVTGINECIELPARKIPTLKKSRVQSPFVVPEIVSLVAGIANETLKSASEAVVEFSGDSAFLYMILTTDLTVLAFSEYYGT